MVVFHGGETQREHEGVMGGEQKPSKESRGGEAI